MRNDAIHDRAHDWEAEARRASLALAEEAKDPASSEARTLKALEANLDDFADEWIWEEES